jgi:hypothetical protein
MKQFRYVSIGAAALVAAGLMAMSALRASAVCVDEMTAGGWIEAGPDAYANFGLNAKQSDGNLTGDLNYVDADQDCHVVSTAITSYTVLDEFCREIEYAVTVNGEAGFTADVIVCDYGEPGDEDTFSITVTDESGAVVPTCSASGVLGGGAPGAGDVQLHLYGNCP